MAPAATPSAMFRPWPDADKSTPNITEMISRMHAEHGGFKNITHGLLRRELKVEEERAQSSLHADRDDNNMDLDVDTSPDVDPADEVETEDEEKKRLQLSREEVFHHIDNARNIAQRTTDLISLLMTKESPTKVADTLDPTLRNLVGVGCLGATKLDEPKPDPEREFDHTSIANGWKTTDFGNSINALQIAAGRLDSVLGNESRYWNGIMQVKNDNWAFCNFNKTTALGVRFGLMDSQSKFKQASLAKLPRSLTDGTPWLQTFRADMNIRIRVTLKRDNKVTGRSALPSKTPDHAPLEARILEARNTIFASELWFELTQEAQTLRSLDVRQPDTTTIICQPPDTPFAIVLTVEALKTPLAGPPEPMLPEDLAAEDMLHSLHLLLRDFQGQNQARRLRRKAYNGNPIPAPPSRTGLQLHAPTNRFLLRPFIYLARREKDLEDLLAFVSELVSCFRCAGFSDAYYKLKTTPTAPKPPSTRLDKRRRKQGATQSSLLGHRNFRIELQLTSQARMSIKGIGILMPLACTQYVVTLLPPPQGENPISRLFPPAAAVPKDAYPSVRDVTTYIRNATTRLLGEEAERISSESARLSGRRPWKRTFRGTSMTPTGERSNMTMAFDVFRPSKCPSTQRPTSPMMASDGADETELDAKYHAALVLYNMYGTGSSRLGETLVWLPDGSGCGDAFGPAVVDSIDRGPSFLSLRKPEL